MTKYVIDIDEKMYEDCKVRNTGHYSLYDFSSMITNAKPLEKVLEGIKAEIDKQEKWLMNTRYSRADIDIAFNAIKLSVGNHISGKE